MIHLSNQKTAFIIENGNTNNNATSNNSHSVQKHAEATSQSAVVKDMPKSYSNRANLIKNIMSNQHNEQLNNQAKKLTNTNTPQHQPTANAPTPATEPPATTTMYTINMNAPKTESADANSNSSQAGATMINVVESAVPKFNSEANTLLKALLQTAPKNAVAPTNAEFSQSQNQSPVGSADSSLIVAPCTQSNSQPIQMPQQITIMENGRIR